MSWEALTWAVRQEAGSPAAKLVLILLANRINTDTQICYPSLNQIAKDSELSRRAVVENIKRLELAGLVIIERRLDQLGRNEPNCYRFPICADRGGRVQEIHQGSAYDDKGGSAPDAPKSEYKKPEVNQKEDGHASFDAFWLSYPWKAGKAEALRAWVKQIGNAAELADRVLAALEIHKQQERWIRDGGEFIPRPATWINQRRWEDQAPTPPKATDKEIVPPWEKHGKKHV